MLWIFRLPVLLSVSNIEYGTANDQCRTEVNIQGMALKRSVFNTYGSYRCTCMEGYTGDGLSCAGKLSFINQEDESACFVVSCISSVLSCMLSLAC